MELETSRAILKKSFEDFLSCLEADVAVVGAGPSGLTAAYFLGCAGLRVVVFERRLNIGGGIWGGGMMLPKIVIEAVATPILKELGVRFEEVAASGGETLYVADAIETAACLCLGAIRAGVKILNGLSVEDVVVDDQQRVRGVVVNWTAVELAGLHVDPLAFRSEFVIDATGHECNVCKLVAKKVGRLATKTGDVVGERSMFAKQAEQEVLENTREIYPGLLVTGMAANAVAGAHRMGAVFGGMLLSGKKAAEIVINKLREGSA
ncbi:MAG: ribose 1,5-bisphosphate isomerase [Candidatus Alkanophagales archaeon]|nr:MAG: ribose 1,5-bisphosphate isomerase [Candidatus Alkanophagales archaeon]